VPNLHHRVDERIEHLVFSTRTDPHIQLILRKTDANRPVIVYVLLSSPIGKTKISNGEKLRKFL
jgi:hypothetical protein